MQGKEEGEGEEKEKKEKEEGGEERERHCMGTSYTLTDSKARICGCSPGLTVMSLSHLSSCPRETPWRMGTVAESQREP